MPTAADSRLPTPGAAVADDPDAAVAWVSDHLGHLAGEGPDGVRASGAFRGGQSAADAALAGLDVAGYAARRNEVWPQDRRGASRMSPYVRHGLVDLPALWQHVGGAPARDRSKYRDELLWQEYARHVYARVGTALRGPLRHEQPAVAQSEVMRSELVQPPAEPMPADPTPAEPWDPRMRCMELTGTELREDGWLVNQTRMWLASQWSVRAGRDWREGEDRMYRNLLDGSRAANRLGWQWTVGTGSEKPYGFSRWQVEKRAPGLCAGCPLRGACPVQEWPSEARGTDVTPPHGLRRGEGPGSAGPVEVERSGEPDAVWLTFESLGDDDPALAAHPGLPVVVVFDEPLLARLRLSGKRLVFLAETVADLALRRDVEVHLAHPPLALAGRAVTVTHASVPGFARRSAEVDVVELHPWRWLVRPGNGPAQSFSAWRNGHPMP